MTEPAVHLYMAVNPDAVDAGSLYFTTAEPTGSVVVASIDRRPVHIRIGTCHCTDHPQHGPHLDTVIFNCRP
ncbi:hypothetical protein [Streptomyces sp. NRRL S-1824]|uniref:hypothetical protein n=1 Tax=Streptomyces sp. NRRL S-1824 TaxID=1463889 RepID=UPI0004CAD2B0|nr:hypothetical protein [Streptomyces sp. NRRL S-1824]